MLDLLDIKKLVLGCVLSTCAGGGIYGLYVKNMSTAAFDGMQANELLQNCMVLKQDKTLMYLHAKEIETLLTVASQKMPEIGRADVVSAIVVGGTAPDRHFQGYSGLLRQCLAELKADFEPIRKEQAQILR